MNELDALLSAHFDDGPTAESSAALRRWLAENPGHVDQFVELSHQHFELYDLLSQQKLSEARVQGSGFGVQEKKVRSWELGIRSWVAVAALVALAAIVWWAATAITPHSTIRNPQSPPVALLTNTENAVFADAPTGGPASAASIRLGSELRPGTLKLTSGNAQVMFRSGAVVDLTGPCEFEMTDANRGRLHYGTIHTLVPAQAIGFTVRGPGGMQVIDLGTEFEMRVDPPNVVLVKVIDGTVEVVAPGNGPANPASAARQVMTAGRAVRLGASTIHNIQLASVFTPSVESCSAQMRAVAAPVAITGGRYQTEAPLVFAERAGVMIQGDLDVTFTEPGMYTNVNQQTATLTGPARVDSYLIHFDPNPAGGGPMTHGTGTITFARPVLGLIATTSNLRETDSRFGAERTEYIASRSGPRGIEDVDQITLSPDRRTITFDLAAGHYSDQVRVLVESQDTNPR